MRRIGGEREKANVEFSWSMSCYFVARRKENKGYCSLGWGAWVAPGLEGSRRLQRQYPRSEKGKRKHPPALRNQI